MTNTVNVTEQNNTVSILEDAPVVTPDPWYTDLKSISTSSGSAVATADTAAHTKGAWTEIIASNAADTSALLVYPQYTGVNGNNTATLLDVGTGAAGAETVVAGDIAIGGLSGTYLAFGYLVPIKITNSTRIAARIQSIVTGGKTATVDLRTFAMGNVTTVPTSVDVLGTSTATSAGTNVGFASYTEVVASTAQEYGAIIAVPSYSSAGGSTNVSPSLFVATGSAGNETDIAQVLYRESTAEAVYHGGPNSSWVTAANIPAGTRLSAKTSTSDVWVTLIGVPLT
jgi:hypothetical protein